MKLKTLIITDHKNHSSENSLYALATALLKHDSIEKVDVVSRANFQNDNFFTTNDSLELVATTIDSGFAFDKNDHPLTKGLNKIDCNAYKFVWLRLPPPLDKFILKKLENTFSNATIINHPNGIWNTGSKEYLLNFKEVCPPMKICRSIEDIESFKEEQGIVLKPFKEYGGKGIVRIDGDRVYSGKEEMHFDEFKKGYHKNPIDYLGVTFQKNVNQGDKRIIVVHGRVLGASLRLPPKDSWICNVAMGGTSHVADITADEMEIIKTINPLLQEEGIVMYGVDTLMGNHGKRILSEINTTSIGGLPQIEKYSGKPLVKEAIELIVQYVITKNTETI